MENEEVLSMVANARIKEFKNNNYIQKYLKVRKLHSEILGNMIDYCEYEENTFTNNLQSIFENVSEELNLIMPEFKIELSIQNEINILYNLAIYNNYSQIRTVTDIFIENDKFVDEDSKKILTSIKKSYAGLFKVNSVDRNHGYVFLEDIFSGRKFRTVDLTLSLMEKTDKYIYSRIITCDRVSFLTGTIMIFNNDEKNINEYIKKYKNITLSPIIKYLSLYDLYKKTKNKVNINTSYI